VHASVAQKRHESGADAFIVGILRDSLGGYTAGIESHSIIFDGKFADIGDQSPNRFEVVAGAGKKINITGRPGDGCLPYEQHQRPLEHETFAGIRLGEAIKPSFDSIVLGDFVEGARGLFRDVQKLLMHRCHDISYRLHRLASR
jgi:hypothetical protein